MQEFRKLDGPPDKVGDVVERFQIVREQKSATSLIDCGTDVLHRSQSTSGIHLVRKTGETLNRGYLHQYSEVLLFSELNVISFWIL